MRRLSLLDYAFLLRETAESPKHVAGLLVVDIPENASQRFLWDLFDTFRTSAPVPPFSQKLSSSFGLPTWTDDPDIDMDNHVIRHVLPDQGTWSQLVDLLSGLHEERLERSRPLWQFHLVEGLNGGKRFAGYLKVHHAYMDGAKMSARAVRSLNPSPDDHTVTPFWSAQVSRSSKRRRKKGLGAKLKSARKNVTSVPELVSLNLGHVPQSLGLVKGEVPAPFSAPRTLLNRPLTPPRMLAAADLPLEAVRRLAKAQGVKVNDVLLEVCDGALRRYFAERGEPAIQALVAQVPIALQGADAEHEGNTIAIVQIELDTTEPDALARLQRIAANSAKVKNRFSGLSGQTAQNYTILWNTVAEALNLVGMTGKARPLGNLVISNLPGPRERLYLGGAPVRALYPISTMSPGASLNITIYTYAGQMHFGLVAGREAIPDLERLATYIEEGLEELKTLAGITDETEKEQPPGLT